MAGLLNKEDITIVLTNEDLDSMIKELLESPVIAFDLENKVPPGKKSKAAKRIALDPFRATLESFQFKTENHVYYVPFVYKGDGGSTLGWDLEYVCRRLFFVWNNPKKIILGHNIKFDLKHLLVNLGKAGYKDSVFKCQLIDTMVADWILDENDRRHGLEHVVQKHLGIEMLKFDDAVNDEHLGDIKVRYACDDVEAPWRLWFGKFDSQIKEEGLNKVFHELEMPFLKVLVEMELQGMTIDTDILQTMEAALEADLEGLVSQIHHEAGQKFLISSPAQLSRILFEVMGFKPKPEMERNKTGNWPTGAEVLKSYKGEHPIFDAIADWRERSKVKTGFTTPLQEWAKEVDGRVRSTFNGVGTVTGRLSSKEPNLQNIPRNYGVAKGIRDAFIAAEGNVIICVDYSQLELRLMAHFSKDPTLLEAYNTKGADVHQITADECGCTRQHAKIINFGLIYGMSPWLLARTLDISVEEAEEYSERYFGKYVGVKKFHSQIWNTLDYQGYVQTLTKRRRRFPEWSSLSMSNWDEKKKKMAFHRQAVNVVIQGSGADLVKISARNIQRKVMDHGYSFRQCSQVHDEIIGECPEDWAEEGLALVIEEMEKAVKLCVPLIAEGSYSHCWGQAKV